MNPLQQIESLIQESKFAEARALANRLKGPNAPKLSILAAIAFKEGDDQQAELLFQRALQENAREGLALLNLGKLYLKQKKVKQAIPLLEKACEVMPGQDQVSLAYAAALSESDRMADAALALKPLVEKERPSLNILTAYCSFLRADLRPQEAFEVLERGQALYPDSFEIEKALADTLAELDPKEAQAAFRKTADRATIQMQWNRSFIELRMGDFETGWSLYDAGLSERIGKIGRPLPHQVRGLPIITKFENLSPEKWTLFSTEQGIGDQVLFLGAMRQAIQDHPKSALICEQRMLPILKRSFPEVEAYPYAFALNLEKQLGRVNGIFPIGSFQKYYRNTLESFKAAPVPFLKPNNLLVDKYRSAIQAKHPGKTLVGVSWTGGFWDRQQRTKSIAFEDLTRGLAKIPNIQLVCLQYGDIEREKKLAKDLGVPISFIAGLDFRKQLDNWFALAAGCDYIVSVSTALVHFMGAINKRVELLLTEKQAPFIWGTQEGQSYAYQSVNIHRRRPAELNEGYLDRILSSLKP